MIVKIKAKSSETSPRILIVGQNPIYTIDRRDGFRLTVFDRDTFKIMADAYFDTFSEAYTSFMKYYNIPGYIGVINGHGKGNVAIAIIDANTQNKLIKKGDKDVYAEYIVTIRGKEESKEVKEENIPVKTGSPEIIQEHEERKTLKNLMYLFLPVAAGIILFRVIKK